MALDDLPESADAAKFRPQRRVARTVGLIAAAVMLALLAFLLWAAPRDDGAIDPFSPMIPGGWMAWTLVTALFFWVIAALILTMLVLALAYPETPRVGILRFPTTRGDRLFVSLLGSAFINLAWLGFGLGPQGWALAVCLIYALAVFRWV